ncbi:MAG: hypothetical protein FJY54_04345 [Betaproteobacteria bacterium]|nr:hypothetical protein [Betaproteobacteria bacterium]
MPEKPLRTEDLLANLPLLREFGRDEAVRIPRDLAAEGLIEAGGRRVSIRKPRRLRACGA